MAELPELLQPGDLLVFNDTRVLPARLAARKPTRRAHRAAARAAAAGERLALVQLRDSKPVRVGDELCERGRRAAAARAARGSVGGGAAERGGGILRAARRGAAAALHPSRPPTRHDRERYQSLFARVPGAVAAPTASLHFDAPLLAALAARGVERASRDAARRARARFSRCAAEQLDEHVMHAERYAVPADTVAAIERARAPRRRA